MAHANNTKTNTYLNGFKFHGLLTSQKGAAFHGAVWESEAGYGVGIIPVESSVKYCMLVPDNEAPFTAGELLTELRDCVRGGFDPLNTAGMYSFMTVSDEVSVNPDILDTLLAENFLTEADVEIIEASIDALKHHYLDLDIV